MKRGSLKRLLAVLAAAVVSISILAVPVSAELMLDTAHGLDKENVPVTWQNPTAIAAMEQQKQQFIVSTRTDGGKVNNLYFTFPKDGGVRIHADTEGFFRPEALSDIAYTAEGDAIVMKAGSTVVKLFPAAKPWRFEVYNSAGKFMTGCTAESLEFGYDAKGVLKKVRAHYILSSKELLFGAGEHYGSFIHNGHTFEMWNYDVGGQLIRPYGNHDLSYSNIPIVYSNDGYVIFQNSTYYGSVDVADTDEQLLSFELWGPILDMYIWVDGYDANLAHYYTLTGSPAVLPEWATHYVHGQSQTVWLRLGKEPEQLLAGIREKWDRYEALGTPIKYLYGEGIVAVKKYSNVMEFLKSRGTQYFGWNNAPFSYFDSDQNASHIGIFENMDRQQLPLIKWVFNHNANWWDKNGDTYTDLTNPLAVEWLKNRFQNYVPLGLTGMMLDYNDNITVDAYYPYIGKSGNEMHNLTAYFYGRAYYEAFKELRGEDNYLSFLRPGCAGTQSWAGRMMGDQSSTFLGMQEVRYALLSGSSSGNYLLGTDIAGIGFSGDLPNPQDVYARWLAFATFVPIMRAHGQHSWRDPWAYDVTGSSEQLFQKYYWLRENLGEMIHSDSIRCSLESSTMSKAMLLAYPNETRLAKNDTQYLFSNQLLVHPVTEDNTSSVKMQFPSGRWVNLMDGSVVYGGEDLAVSATLSEIPVYIQDGGAFPVTYGEDIRLGTITTTGNNVAGMVVTPAVNKRSNAVYTDRYTKYTVTCEKTGNDTYRAVSDTVCERRVVVAMGAHADTVAVDGRRLLELKTRPNYATTTPGFYYDAETNSTIIVTDGSWSRVDYNDTGYRLKNLALDGKATLLGTEDETEQASAGKAIDAAFDTVTSLPEGSTLLLDLGKDETIETVTMRWDDRFARRFVLQASKTGEENGEWVTLYEKKEVLGNLGTVTARLETPTAYRYLRVTDVAGGQLSTPRITELEVYGSEYYLQANNAKPLPPADPDQSGDPENPDDPDAPENPGNPDDPEDPMDGYTDDGAGWDDEEPDDPENPSDGEDDPNNEEKRQILVTKKIKKPGAKQQGMPVWAWIVIAGAAVLVITGGVLWFLLLKRKKDRAKEALSAESDAGGTDFPGAQ